MKVYNWVKFGLIGLVTALLFGCATAPFGTLTLSSLPQSNSGTVIKSYLRRQPQCFTATAGIVFDWHYRKLSTLCVTRVDCSLPKISVVGMNLLGVKIFSASGRPQKAKMLFCALKSQIKDPDAFATAMIRDIGRIYCHKLTNYRILKRRRQELQVTVNKPDGIVITYIFTGRQPRLIKKFAMQRGAQLWQVKYFSCKDYGKARLPDKIIYNNFHNGYRLIIRVKNVTDITLK